MTRFKKGRIVGLASVAVLLTGVVGIGTHSAGAAVSDDFALVTSVGYLSLEIRNSGTRVVQYNVAGTEVDTETVTVTNKCEVTSPGRLLAFTSSTGKVGQVNAGFGTKTKNNCSTDEGRVGIAPESIVVTLGSKFAADISIDRSELDIEGKFSASLSWSTNATPGTSGVALLNTTSDNGPDSGAADNNRVGIGTAGSFVDNYRALTLRAIGGSSEIALDGGGDGTYPPAQANSKGSFNSIFLLVSTSFYDYTVPCSTSVLPDAGDNTSDSAGGGLVRVGADLRALAQQEPGGLCERRSEPRGDRWVDPRRGVHRQLAHIDHRCPAERAGTGEDRVAGEHRRQDPGPDRHRARP